MAETAGALLLGQIDGDEAGFVMGFCRIFAAFAAGTECNAKFAIQGKCPGRDIQYGRHVHERIKGLIQVLLTLSLLDPVPKLDAKEAKGIPKHLRRDILTIAHIDTDARLIGLPAFIRDLLGLLQLIDQFGIVRILVGPSLFYRIEWAFNEDRVAPDLLANPITSFSAPGIDLKAGFLLCGRVDVKGC